MRPHTTTLGLVLAVAAFSAPRSLAQETASSSLPADDVFVGIPEQIEAIQSSQGINSPELIGPLTNLGLIFREQEDVDLAIAAFERARHLVRVNYGLSSFREAPLLRQLVQIEEARGNAAVAWDLEHELLGLIRRYPGPAAAPMLREIADKRVDVLERYSRGEFPPQIELGCYYSRRYGNETTGNGEGSCRSGTSSSVKQALYEEASGYYFDTIDMIALSRGESTEDIPELYLAVVRASYAARNDHGTEGYGRGVLRHIHSLLVDYSKPLAEQMTALVRVVDWELLYAGGRQEKAAAFQAYEALYAHLEQQNLEQRFIDEIFSPSVPVVLPAFSPAPLGLRTTPGASGAYLDVAFDITKYGEGKAIEILDTSTRTTDTTRLRLRDIIQRSKFRPRMANGAFEDPARVVVRYYVDD